MSARDIYDFLGIELKSELSAENGEYFEILHRDARPVARANMVDKNLVKGSVSNRCDFNGNTFVIVAVRLFRVRYVPVPAFVRQQIE